MNSSRYCIFTRSQTDLSSPRSQDHTQGSLSNAETDLSRSRGQPVQDCFRFLCRNLNRQRTQRRLSSFLAERCLIEIGSLLVKMEMEDVSIETPLQDSSRSAKNPLLKQKSSKRRERLPPKSMKDQSLSPSVLKERGFSTFNDVRDCSNYLLRIFSPVKLHCHFDFCFLH